MLCTIAPVPLLCTIIGATQVELNRRPNFLAQRRTLDMAHASSHKTKLHTGPGVLTLPHIPEPLWSWGCFVSQLIKCCLVWALLRFVHCAESLQISRSYDNSCANYIMQYGLFE